MDVFFELSLLMIFVLFISIFMNYIKQPLLIGYIITGIIASPLFFNIFQSNEAFEVFAQIGVALLLFIVGLHLKLKLIREVGLISLITGLGQVIFTSFFGFLIAYMLGFSFIASIIIAIALTFSSTIIIVKILTDKNDLDKLYGKVSMGFLIVQDFVAAFVLMLISSFMNLDAETSIAIQITTTILYGIIAIIATYFISSLFLPKLLNKVSKSSELLFIFVLAWCLGVSALFHFLGFSLEIGALLAGIALASSPYQFELSAKIKPLRDFFIVLFFIILGAQMLPDVPEEINSISEKSSYIWDSISHLILPIILFTLFILIGNPIIVLLLMTLLGYSSRTGFLAGLTVAQISEFSLILAMMAQKAEFLSSDEVTMITFIGIITITGSTYMILNGEFIYKKFSKILRKLERKELKDKNYQVSSNNYDILIFGYDRIGYALFKTIKKLKKSYVIIDYDPFIIKKLKKNGIECIYGDASNIELISQFEIEKSQMVISTIPEYEISSLLLNYVKTRDEKVLVILTANHIDDALRLYEKGADYVILPHFLGGEYVSALIEDTGSDIGKFLEEKVRHINDLKQRKKHGHEHPK